MGCSAAKNVTVEQLSNGPEVQNNGDDGRKVSITRRASEVPALQSEEPQTEMLDSGTLNNLQECNNGLSFDIAFEEEGESIIKKHPPKRFQKLEEQQTSPNLSLQKLQEKLNDAEQRRQLILQQRVASAKVRKGLKKQSNVNGESAEDDDLEDLENLDNELAPPDASNNADEPNPAEKND